MGGQQSGPVVAPEEAAAVELQRLLQAARGESQAAPKDASCCAPWATWCAACPWRRPRMWTPQIQRTTRLEAEVSALKVRLEQARELWQKQEAHMKKVLRDKTLALQAAMTFERRGSSRSSFLSGSGRNLGQKRVHFELLVPHSDRKKPLEAIIEASGRTVSTMAEIDRRVYVEDVDGNVLPSFVQWPEDPSAYPLSVRYKDPGVCVANPRLRGVRMGDLLDFFDREVGEIVCDGDDERKSVCLPSKLARVCNRFNVRNGARSSVELSPNLYAVEALFIRPLTEARRVSLAEEWRPDGCLIEAFVSHCWVEDFGEFCQSTYRYALQRAQKGSPGLSAAEVANRARDLNLYICAFSNNQWNLSVELGNNIEDSPFYKVLKAESTTAVVMNMDQMGALLFRAWCTFEFYFSHELKKEVVLNTRFGPLREIHSEQESEKLIQAWIVHVFELLQDVDIRLARATSTQDLAMIQRRISDFAGTGVAHGLRGADALNRLLKSMVADQVLPMLARVGNTAALKRALDCGASPDAEDCRRVRALTYAAAAHGPCGPAAQILLDAGADRLATVSARTVVEMFGDLATERKQAIKKIQALRGKYKAFHMPALKIAQEEHARRVRAALEQLAMHSWAAATDDAQDVLDVSMDREASHGGGSTPASTPMQELSQVFLPPPSIFMPPPSPNRGEGKAASMDLRAPPPPRMHSGASSQGSLALPAGSSQPTPTPHSTAACIAAHLQTGDEDARRAACEVLGDLGEAGMAHVDDIAGCLTDTDDGVRCAAVSALARLGGVVGTHLACIAERLEDDDDDVRRAACEALAHMREASDDHARAIANSLADSDAKVRQAACEALASLTAEAAAPHIALLAERLDDPEVDVRRAALAALAQLGETASGQAPAIAKCLEDEDWRTRKAAVDALACMGPKAMEFMPAFAEALQDKDGDVRKAGCEAFASLSAQMPDREVATAQHMMAIMECLEDTDDVREAAEEALVQMRNTGMTPTVSEASSASPRRRASNPTSGSTDSVGRAMRFLQVPLSFPRSNTRLPTQTATSAFASAPARLPAVEPSPSAAPSSVASSAKSSPRTAPRLLLTTPAQLPSKCSREVASASQDGDTAAMSSS